MKKLLLIICALAFLMCAVSCGKSLEMTHTVIYMPRNESRSFYQIEEELTTDTRKVEQPASTTTPSIEEAPETAPEMYDPSKYENSQKEEKTEEIKISNEKIATFDGEHLRSGDTFGETKAEIRTNDGKGSFTIKVVPYIEWLEIYARDEYYNLFYGARDSYYAARYLLDNINVFKNPASVSLGNSFSKSDKKLANGAPAYYIMELRAQNSFGGYNLAYYKVSPNSIEQITPTWNSTVLRDLPGWNNEQAWRVSLHYLDEVLAEYAEGIS